MYSCVLLKTKNKNLSRQFWVQPSETGVFFYEARFSLFLCSLTYIMYLAEWHCFIDIAILDYRNSYARCLGSGVLRQLAMVILEPGNKSRLCGAFECGPRRSCTWSRRCSWMSFSVTHQAFMSACCRPDSGPGFIVYYLQWTHLGWRTILQEDGWRGKG